MRNKPKIFMNKNVRALTILSIGVLSLCGLWIQTTRADVALVEAEANPSSGDIKVHDIAGASGGKVVSIARDWQPLLRTNVPQTGNEFTVWTRHSSGSILLKTRTGGTSKDLKWIYDKPVELKWTRAGRWTLEQLGEQLEIIRGGGGGQGPFWTRLSSPRMRITTLPRRPRVLHRLPMPARQGFPPMRQPTSTKAQRSLWE